jgi:DNA repair protein RAD7
VRQIRDTADERRRAAARTLADAEAEREGADQEVAESSTAALQLTTTRKESKAEEVKRKKEEQKVIEKIKASKAFKKRKRYESEDDDDALARAMYAETRAPIPGQMENCEICDKRFTVTPYNRTGPNGRLVCMPCGKNLDKIDGPSQKKKPRKVNAGMGRRRKMQSNILDGIYLTGAKTLMTLCLETLAKNVELAESLGELPEHVVDKIARLFSKRRLLASRTLPLFIQPTTEVLKVYDGAKLSPDDLRSIFQVCHNLKYFKLRNGIHFKDEVMDYLLTRSINLETICLHGSNLLTNAGWEKFLSKQGSNLQALQVYHTDNYFGDDQIKLMCEQCPNLKRLKICHNQQMTQEGVASLTKLKHLEHLSLFPLQNIPGEEYLPLIREIGSDLKTLSLRNICDADDELLAHINANCRSLVKLRLIDSEKMTDAGFVNLFTNWENPPLHFIEFSKCRFIQGWTPRCTNEEKVGLCSDGFRALMGHSGKQLEHLNLHACRHISRDAFEDVFAEQVYPHLAKMEVSFIDNVDDYIVNLIFRACPSLRELNVFGCMKVKDAMVPKGRVLVGVPNAHGMVIEGSV